MRASGPFLCIGDHPEEAIPFLESSKIVTETKSVTKDLAARMLIRVASNQNIKSTKHVLANSDKNVQNFKQRLALSEDLCWKFNETRSFQNSH